MQWNLQCAQNQRVHHITLWNACKEYVTTVEWSQESDNIHEAVNALPDLIEEGSVVSIAAAEDESFDYYLFKVLSRGAITLPDNEVDDYNAAYQKGSFVLQGNFFSQR